MFYKILALCGEQKVFQKENCFSNLTGLVNSFYKIADYHSKIKISQPVHNLFYFYFAIIKNILSFAIAFVNDRYHFYTLTY